MTEKNNTTQFHNEPSARDLLKGLSNDDFLNFGIQDIAYVRAVDVEGQKAYAIHAADGTPLSVVEDEREAYILAKQNDLETTQIH